MPSLCVVWPASWTTTGHVYDVGNGHNGDPAACGESVPSTATTATRPSTPKNWLNALIRLWSPTGEPLSPVLPEMQGNLETLVNTKQRGRNLAELIVLVMLAFLVAGMAVFARTETQAWLALVNDVALRVFVGLKGAVVGWWSY